VLEMGTEQRYDIYDLFLRFPEPLVPRSRRLEVAERLDRDGRVVTPLDLDGVRAAVRRLVDEGVDALALCFLHSYADPAHERRAGFRSASSSPVPRAALSPPRSSASSRASRASSPSTWAAPPPKPAWSRTDASRSLR